LAPGKRNEALDGVAYATAARAGLALNLEAREQALRLNPVAAPRQNIVRSKWIDSY